MTRLAGAEAHVAKEPWPLENVQLVSRLLQPLANPVRLNLLGYLRKPHYLEEIAAHLGMSRQAARKHVKHLLDAGWVTRGPRDDAHVVEYALSLQALLRFKSEVGLLATVLMDGLDNPMAAMVRAPAEVELRLAARTNPAATPTPQSLGVQT